MGSPSVSERIIGTIAPAILEARTWLAAYDGSRGVPLDLSQAAPPYAPPPGLLDRLSEAAALTDTARYGPVQGEPALRAAYARHASRLYGADIEPENVAITGGCNQAFFIAAMLTSACGDAIVLPAPWYFNHQMTLEMLGIQVRALPCAAIEGFVPNIEELEKLIDPAVRAVVLVSPNNPTGAIYPATVLEEVAALCHRRGVWLILDETYRDFLPAGERPHALFAGTYRDAVIGLYSFSKSMALPAIGWAR